MLCMSPCSASSLMLKSSFCCVRHLSPTGAPEPRLSDNPRTCATYVQTPTKPSAMPSIQEWNSAWLSRTTASLGLRTSWTHRYGPVFSSSAQ